MPHSCGIRWRQAGILALPAGTPEFGCLSRKVISASKPWLPMRLCLPTVPYRWSKAERSVQWEHRSKSDPRFPKQEAGRPRCKVIMPEKLPSFRRLELEPVPIHALNKRCGGVGLLKGSYLVDPASSHMLVSKIKPCMSKYKLLIL